MIMAIMVAVMPISKIVMTTWTERGGDSNSNHSDGNGDECTLVPY